MKTRNTLILGILAVGIILFGYFYERTLPTTKDREDEAGHILNFDRDKVTRVSIQNGDDKITLERKGESWEMADPVRDQADTLAVSQLLTECELLEKIQTIPAEGSKEEIQKRLKEFGLSKATLRFKLEGPNAPPALLFGKDSAVEEKIYSRFDGSDDVFVTGIGLKTQVTRKPSDFRDQTLAALDPKRIEKLRIKTGAGEIVLAQEAGDWQIKKPLQARGDNERIPAFVNTVLGAKVQSFLENQELGEVQATIQVQTDRDKLSIDFGTPIAKQEGLVPARSSTRPGGFLLRKELAFVGNITPNDLRDRKLLRFDLDLIDRIRVQVPGKSGLLLTRSQDGWQVDGHKGMKVPASVMDRFIAQLAAAKVTKFVSDVGSELPKYGLDQPSLQVTFSSYASENTAESLKGERTVTAVLFGSVEGDSIYAKVEEEPFIVCVPKSLLDEIPAEWESLQSNTILNMDPSGIGAVAIVSGTNLPVSVVRESADTWRLNPPIPGVNTRQGSVNALVATVAHLQAARWAGKTRPEHGLANPMVIITLTTSKSTRLELRISSVQADGMYYASLQGAEGTFLLPKPTVEILTAPLTE